MVVAADSPGAFGLLRDRLAAVGGVAIIPCDTIYGLVGTVPGSEERIRRIKGRGEDKPFLQLVAGADWVARLAAAPIPASLEKHWPGPLTVILPGLGGGTVALRVPDSLFLRELLSAMDMPVYSTSVNRAGQAPLWRIADIVEGFEDDVDLVMDAGDLPGAVPSTIVDATCSPLRIVRQGALALSPADLL
jgi:L-threonylcarbamoyladenylate synthase